MPEHVITDIAHFFEKLFPIFLTVSFYGSLATVVLFAISGVSRGSRRWTGRLIVLITYVWAITIWLYAGKNLYHIWGARGLLGGLVLFLLGVIPVAGLAMAMSAHWVELGCLVLALIIFSAVRAFATKLDERIHRRGDGGEDWAKAHRGGA